jgi:DNA-binding XRE family transcriptional regulator
MRLVTALQERSASPEPMMPRPATDPAKAAQIKILRQQAGRWLKTAREEARLTQAELAEKVGLRYYTFVSQVESGLGRLPIETQGAWAEALGLEPGEFAKTLLRYYEPELYRLLFGAESASQALKGQATG